MTGLKLTVETNPVYSFAFNQNQYPMISRLELSLADEQVGSEQFKEMREYENIEITLSSDPVLFDEEKWFVDKISTDQSIRLQRRIPKLSAEYLEKLSEQVTVDLTFSVAVNDEIVLVEMTKIDILPKNHWAGESRMAELLAAFVTPNSNYIEELVKKAADLLMDSGESSKLDGYQSGTRERPYLMTAAIWNVVCSEAIVYVTPPASFAIEGQKIRLPDHIGKTKMAACLDTSLLFAACLEYIGLNSVVALTKNHACVGVWLIDDRFPILTNDDPMDLRKRIAAKDLILFETTLVTSDHSIRFAQAVDAANELVSEGKEDDFVFAIDLSQARKRQIRPLPTLRDLEDPSHPLKPATPSPLPVVPPLPPVRKDDLVVEESPETRVDQWQRKLLDLTKRNRLLNLATNSVAIKLFCPDISALEDQLAAKEEFKFITPEGSPYADSERDSTTFRFSTGNDLQTEFAREQLKSNTLIANESTKKLDGSLLNLFRKAKTDLEEGGSNTLYMTIGMLRWKETADSERSYRAPLILLPVQLLRASARSKIRLRQIPDELPIFNSTLIEFLDTDYEIDLNQYRNELPTDSSGIDVGHILDTVRLAVKEVPGFEVVEELVVSTFSFAKYLMWRDLKDRVDDLKKNLFVHHLIERPQSTYVQETDFLDISNIDNLLKPSEIYAPLNADSSQLVAIAASAKSQDFVLEGPPGTGKSETIANIIAHNLAKGRKVLFVAEKMAALNVVYRRLERVHLDHLCMELHSNKANKSAVLEQLRNSWSKREEAGQSDWKENAENLLILRNGLNEYVNELHQRSVFGLSARQAIARVTRFARSARVTLDWRPDLASAPVKNEADLDSLYKTTKSLAIAYKDVEGIDISSFSLVNHADWSNTWQSELVQAVRQLEVAAGQYHEAMCELSTFMGFSGSSDTIEGGEKLSGLAVSVPFVVKRSYGFALAGDSKSRMERLENIISNKRALDEKAKVIGLNFILEKACDYPVEQWVTQLGEADEKFWPLSWFAKSALKKQMASAGLSKPDNFGILVEIREARRIALEIRNALGDFSADNVWQGWGTSANEMEARLSEGRRLSTAIKGLAENLDDPSLFVKEAQKRLDENRAYLDDHSPLVDGAKRFIECRSVFNEALAKFVSLGGVAPSIRTSLVEFKSTCIQLCSSERQLNSWCHWIEAKTKADETGLRGVISALEAGLISHEEAVEQTTTAFCAWAAPVLIDQSPTLRRFHASSHDLKIDEFRDLDAFVAKTTSEYIASLAAAGVPDADAPDSPAAYGVLSRELQKKSRHKPVRMLIQEMGTELLNLVPCMMMSPLSVAQFLPADFNEFDLVIFDEASQITVWDAVGAIARGKNVIVVGDPKQMPPTNFFGRSAGEEEPDEEDLESILDQALAARLPHHRLTGHYRSRHESLIAFSNSKYYENSLVTFPSSSTVKSAVKLHRVDGLYSKGKGRNNVIEAQAVADEVVRRLRDSRLSKLSIGVVTLNSEQQRAIEDALDDHRRRNSSIEIFFQATDNYDPVFIKNLESVQGDERDVIILSLGYGPVEPGAKTISMNFGPLNKQGGERRLNVAITRATTELLVFSSFDSSMIDLSRTQATAVAHLKEFLDYADRGPIALAQSAVADHGVDQFDSDFEQGVAYELRERGWRVQTQIGVSKFRIDLGIVHPEHPGRYLAGIECDGATYHSSPSARDRDRVRQIILENLGWKLIRLWSTDYFLDPAAAIERIDKALKLLLEVDGDALGQEKHVVIESVASLPDELTATVSEEQIDGEVASRSSTSSVIESGLDAERYFEPAYEPVLNSLARQILSKKNGIQFKELVLDIAREHGMARTSQKQISHMHSLVQNWAGLAEYDGQETTIWDSPESVCDVIAWRGVDAFEEVRTWNVLPYPERLGLAKLAVEKSAIDPVGFICVEIGLTRRSASTLAEFESWVSEVADKNE